MALNTLVIVLEKIRNSKILGWIKLGEVKARKNDTYVFLSQNNDKIYYILDNFGVVSIKL